MSLYLDVGPDDLLRIGNDTIIAVERKSGSRARLRITGTAEIELMKRARTVEPPAPDGEGDGRSK